jgi:diguanylate cyclase (GGDEF)-like protein
VAGPTSGDPPVRSTIGSVAGQQENSAAASSGVDADQRLADRQQTLADADQAGSNRDQTAADNDQAAADSDQAASDRDHEHGGDAEIYYLTRGLRDRSTRQRQQGADGRFEVAAARDAAAHARDLIASERDEAAAMRDWQLARRDADDAHVVTAAEIGARAAESRERAAEDRDAAAKSRARSAADRAKAARDRAQAAHDRMQAQADRAELLHQLAIAETDAVTGARTRAAGLPALGSEIDRAREKKASLVAAYVDVVGLRAANSDHGHAAGDVLLQRTARAVRGRVRSSDLFLRLGDDEFLCAMFGETLENARLRFESVRAALADDPYPCEIKVGLTALAPGDSVERLIQRAGAALPSASRR